MQMKIEVEFYRNQADDAEAIGKPEPTPQEFAIQLTKELQEAYDNEWIAGSFQVVRVTLENGTSTNIVKG